MNIGYVAVETFIPDKKYKEFSKLFQVEEVISLDCALCPSVVEDEQVDDKYRYSEEYESYYDIVNDLDILLKYVTDREEKQILAVVKEPEYDCSNDLLDKRFKFYGYDLLEDYTRISALSNCGGFDKAFRPEELSEFGLIKEYKKAREIQLLLEENYPNEEHAECALWAIWRMEGDIHG